MKRLIVLAATLLLPVLACAQDELAPGEEVEEIRRYTVEIIIFAYTQDTYTGSEVFVPDVVEAEDVLPADGEERVFEELPAAEPETEEAPIVRDLELVMLEQEQFSLGDARDRLERLDAYEPLMHFGWTQATYPEEETPAIELRAFGRVPAGLDGNLSLYLSRYLHLVVDLVLDAEPGEGAQAVESQRDFSFSDERAGADGLYGMTAGPVRYRIQEDRILKNAETRYFDHPKFGVIARVTRVEQDESEENELDESQELVGRRRQ